MTFWQMILNWLERRRRAKDWRPVRIFKQETWWADVERSGGWTVYSGYENGLGQRKIYLLQKPEWPSKPSSLPLLQANEWLCEPKGNDGNPPKLRVLK